MLYLPGESQPADSGVVQTQNHSEERQQVLLLLTAESSTREWVTFMAQLPWDDFSVCCAYVFRSLSVHLLRTAERKGNNNPVSECFTWVDHMDYVMSSPGKRGVRCSTQELTAFPLLTHLSLPLLVICFLKDGCRLRPVVKSNVTTWDLLQMLKAVYGPLHFSCL